VTSVIWFSNTRDPLPWKHYQWKLANDATAYNDYGISLSDRQRAGPIRNTLPLRGTR